MDVTFVKLALANLVTPERQALILDACNTLNELGISSHMEEIQTVVEIGDSYADNTMFVGRIEDAVTITLINTIGQFGVFMSDEADFPEYLAVLNTLTKLDSYILPDSLLTLLCSELPDIDIFTMMIPLFSTYTYESIADFIQRIDETVVPRIGKTISQIVAVSAETFSEPTSDNTMRVARLNRLFNLVGITNCKAVYEMHMAGVKVGRPFEDLISQIDLNTTDLKQIAIEIFALALFSDLPLEQIAQVVRAVYTEFTEDALEINQMNQQLDAMLPVLGE